MVLYIRMVLYAVSAGLAGYGFAAFDSEAGTITFNIEQVASVIGGAVAFVGTFIASRFSRVR